MTQTTDATIAALERLEAIAKLGFDLDWDEEYRAAVPALCRALRIADEALAEIATGAYAGKTFTRDAHARNARIAIAAELEAVDGE